MTFNSRLNPFTRLALVLASMLAVLFGAGVAAAQDAAVRVTQNSETFTLDNGVIRAVVSKRTGDLVALAYKGVETMTPDAGGHSAAYWSHDTTGGKDVIARVSIDPATNGGERAEVSVKGISGGIKMGHGPGTATSGDIELDIDTRYALGRGDHGVYTYMAFTHPVEYGTGTMAEARIAVELADYFDNIHVDALRSGKFPITTGPGADKYTYTTKQAEERAEGWTSSSKHMGWFLINPSAEYLSGGPNKAEFVAHKEPSPGPAVLNYWKSSHYGGSNVTVIEGERWTRVIGPFMFYVNEGATHEAMVADAKVQLKKEEAKWPYAWVEAEGYAKPAERGSVTGQFVLDDKLGPFNGRFPGKIMVGLTKTPYDLPPPPPELAEQMRNDGRFANTRIEWQADGKFLQFWSRNDNPDGRFKIEKVAPGKYNLYAFADGVIGEYSKAEVTVPVGGNVDLGTLVWTPVRMGRQVWEIGTADRDAKEFANADRYFYPGSQLERIAMFPNGVTYRIGQSTPGKDWFFAQAPTPPAGVTPVSTGFSGIQGTGEATPYRIVFDMPAAARGAATLRFVFTTNSTPGIEVAVNGTPVGVTNSLRDSALSRHQMYGRYSEANLSFDATLLKAGENTVTLTVPAGGYDNGAVYDYIRLELDEAAPTPPKPTVLAVPAPRAPAGGGGGGGAPGAATPASEPVVTIHDDARLGLPSPMVNGSRYFAQGNAIMVQTGNGAPRQLVAPKTLDVWAVSPDGKRLAYATPDTDEVNGPLTIRVVDTATGAPVAEEVPWARQTAIAWSPDSKGFYYSGGNPPPPGSTRSGGGLVFYHTLGQPRADDRRVLWSDRGGMVHYAEISDDGHWLVINGSVRGDGKSEINLIDLTIPVTAPFKAMRRLSERWQFAGSNGAMLYFVTDFGAERGRVVSMDTSKSSLPIAEVVPQGAQRLQAARLKGGQLTLSYAGASAPTIRTVSLNTSR